MKNYSRYITIGVSVLLVGYLIYTFSTLVMWVIISWVLAMLGQPLMRFFQRYVRTGRFRLGAGGAAVLTLLCFFMLLLGVVLLFLPLVVQEANALAKVDYAAVGRSLQEPLAKINTWLVRHGVELDSRSPEQIVRETLTNVLNPSSISAFFSSSISAFSTLLVGLFSVAFITFFFLQEQGMFASFVTALVPEKHEARTREAIDDISRMLTRYFGGVALQVLIIAVYVSVFLSILGVKNAVLIGFFAALLNLIPYLGPLLGGMLGVLIAITTNLEADFNGVLLPLAGKVALVFVTVQMLDNYVLMPLIYSSTVKAHPLEIFIVILVGAQLNGILGMVLAIPTYTVVRVIARTFLSRFKIVQQFTNRLDEVEPAETTPKTD
ncbi:MAG TPA: AI-2E family transporter [Saprospiraceae bacterium]|nr:AI-2E family transporter [Saprospiraceae bacterium]HMP22727.1 AI-2E family transporter [Saprospiraceae bacterium]